MDIPKNEFRNESVDADSPCEIRNYQYQGKKLIGYFPMDGTSPSFFGLALIQLSGPGGQQGPQIPQEFIVPGATTVSEAFSLWDEYADKKLKEFKDQMEQQQLRQKLTQGIQLPNGPQR